MQVISGEHRRAIVDLTDVRVAGGLMLAAAAVRVAVPGTPGLPCPLRTLTGIPCPLCGMTTSVTETVRFDLGDAVSASPAGPLLVVAVVAVLLLGRRFRAVAVPWSVVPALLAPMWLYQLHRFSIL